MQALADHPRDCQAERLIRVCDHRNTHAYASLYRTFPPVEARRRAQRVQRVFTPRHGRWLRRAEPELSVLTRQALSPRHAAQTGIHWQFRAGDARVPLKHLCHTIEK